MNDEIYSCNTFEFRGKTYKKEHEGDFSGTSTQDKDFWEQMEVDGIHNKEILDAVYEYAKRMETDSLFFMDCFPLVSLWCL